MNVLILGGNGFIGSHLTDACLQEHYQVRVLARSPEKYRAPLPNVDYRIGNFHDRSLVEASLEGIDVVIHALSSTVPSTSNQHPEQDIQDNLLATVAFLDAMRNKGVQRIIFFSSGGTIYGNPLTIPIPETHPIHPMSSYGIVKISIEYYLSLYQSLHGLKPLILRPSNIYGPRHGHVGVQGVITTFLHALSKNQPMTVWGDGSIVRDYIFIDDVITLSMELLKRQDVGVFHVGAGVGYSVNEVIGAMAKVTQKTPKVIYEPGRSFDIEKVILDITKTKNTFHWTPKISLEHGIQAVWEWMKTVV